MQNYKQDLVSNNIYHIFNRAIGDEKLFFNSGDYEYFLTKMETYILPVAKIFTYTLMPNHFHIILKIKTAEDLKIIYKIKKGKEYNSEAEISAFLIALIGHLLNAYAKYYNRINNRKGALFMDSFKRSIVNHDADFSAFIFYAHKNAVHHGYTSKIGHWPYDGYNKIISDEATFLEKIEVLKWFGGIQGFLEFHNQNIEVKNAPYDLEF